MRMVLESVICLTLSFAGSIATFSQVSADIASPKHKAWDTLVTAAFSRNSSERTNGIRALGLLQGDTQARELAEAALNDSKPEVRSAAATALGQMHAVQSITKLQRALSDKKISVVMAAAQSLRQLKDDKSAYDVYYELLTGERKSNDGLIARQLDTLKNPKEMAQIGLSEGIGFIPFAGIGWDAYRTMHKKDPNPVRAVAAKFLTHDPDPASARALVKATRDRDWIVRAAALEAIAQRGDPSLLPSAENRFSDRNSKVRYTAAAAVIRLSALEPIKTARNP